MTGEADMGEFLETTHDKFIFKVKTGYLYSKEDLWVRIDDGTATVGVTDFLQKSQGDVTFLDIIESGTMVKRGQELGKIETIKAIYDIISPVSGKITRVNSEVDANSYLINQDPYGAGWICRIELSDWEGDRKELLQDSDYFEIMRKMIAKEAK
jgi:glycine cleavage system H protein